MRLQPDAVGGWRTNVRGVAADGAPGAFELAAWVVPAAPSETPPWRASAILTVYREHSHSKCTGSAACAQPTDALDLAWFRLRAAATKTTEALDRAQADGIGAWLRTWLVAG